MAAQADDDDPGPGGAPRPGPSLPELLAAFEHGGAWEAAAPSAALAAILEACAGPDGLYDGADAGSLVGIARQWAALESWAAAGTLAALRAMTREDGEGRPLTRRRMDLPDGWTDSLNYEIAAALAMGPVSAGNLAALAWTLGLRLPGIGRLLADGALTKPKAKLIAQTFEPLDEGEAARAEALILGELPGKTWPQVQRLAWRAALTVAPDAAERRRRAAPRRRRAAGAGHRVPRGVRRRRPVGPRPARRAGPGRARQRAGPRRRLPPSQTVTRLDPHPTQTRLAPMDHPHRTHLHPRTLAIHRITRNPGGSERA